MSINILDGAKLLLQDAHETLEGTMSGVTNEVANWQPDGKALSIAAAYTHALVSEDMLLNTMLRQNAMLLENGWNEKMGLNTPHPAVTETWEQDFATWTKTVRVELPKLQEYSKAVYQQTNEYLAALSEEEFATKNIDLSGWGMGDYPLWRFFYRFIIGHADNLTGEISAVKGLQNLKGYPF